MRTVSALFDTNDQVVTAVDGLSEIGVPSGDITVISQRRGAFTRITEGAGIGAAIGGICGFLADFGIFGIFGQEWTFGTGWLVPVLLGAAAGGVAGGIIGSLMGGGRVETDVPVRAENLPSGGALLVARVHDDEVGDAKAILLQCGAVGTNAMRSEYAADSWDGFVAKDIWDEDIGSEDQRLSEEKTRRRRVA